jgi:hypothetical protein
MLEKFFGSVSQSCNQVSAAIVQRGNTRPPSFYLSFEGAGAPGDFAAGFCFVATESNVT